MLLLHPPTTHWRCIHIYAVGIYICMHVAECAIQNERLLRHARSVCCVFLAKQRDCVWSSAVHRVTHYVQSMCAAFGLKHLTCICKSDCNLQPSLVLLQDVPLYPNVVMASALISWSSWLWPWTLPMRCTWWLMGNSELKSGSVFQSYLLHFWMRQYLTFSTLHNRFILLHSTNYSELEH